MISLYFLLALLSLHQMSFVVSDVRDDYIYDFTHDLGLRKYMRNRWTEITNTQIGLRLIYALANQSGEECQNQSRTYLQAYEKESLWAVTMQDASAQSMEGILAGNTYHMGNFDECLGVAVNMEPTAILGQYCLLHLQFQFQHTREHLLNSLRSQIFEVNGTIKDFDNYSPFVKAWDLIKPSEDPSKFPRDKVYWAVCLPSTCSPNEIQIALQKELRLITSETDINITGIVDPTLCQTEKRIQDQQFTSSDLSFSVIVILLAALVICSSTIDYVISPTPSTRASKLFLCFSARKNLKSLSKGDLAGSGFDAIHGLRLLFMILAIAGHRFMVNFGGPLHNVKIAEEGYRNSYNMFIMNGMMVVDTFFVYSGCLTAYYLPLELDKRHINPLMIWVYRIIRLSPVYLFVLLFHASLLENLGSGPLWPKIVGLEARRCERNWWTNLLYINNYVETGEMCMFQTWYLAVDTHLFLIAVLIVYVLWSRPTFGYIFLALGAVLSVLIPFVCTYIYEADAFLLLYRKAFEDPVASDYFKYMYAVSHIRAGPYVVGVSTGFLLYKLRGRDLEIPLTYRYLGHIFAVTVCVTAQYGGFVFYMPQRNYSVLEASTYSAFHRAAWGFGIALNVFLLVRGRIDWLHRMLTWPPLVPISRLTYCAYLVHTITHLYELGTLRNPKFITYYMGTWMFIGDIIVTFVLSFFLNLIVEAPFRAIEKSIFGRSRREGESENLELRKVEKVEKF